MQAREDKLFDKWKEWLEVLDTEVRNLFHNSEMFFMEYSTLSATIL